LSAAAVGTAEQKVENGKTLVKVRWRDWGEDTWEPVSMIGDIDPDVRIALFHVRPPPHAAAAARWLRTHGRAAQRRT
jgi:hypothetical protein